MTIYAMWHGGSNYAVGDLSTDLESFPTMTAAREALKSRETDGYGWRQRFNYVNRAPESCLTPCADHDSSMWVYFADPTETADPYPDRVLSFGPRGGVVESFA